MSKHGILHGETVVCSHSKRWIDAARIELGMSESEIVERIINGYVHSWHQQFEIPTNTSYTTLVAAIRRQLS